MIFGCMIAFSDLCDLNRYRFVTSSIRFDLLLELLRESGNIITPATSSQ